MFRKYQEEKPTHTSCFMCSPVKVKREFDNFYIRPNDYPYDAIAETHDLLVFKSHRAELSILDEVNLKEIIKTINDEKYYDSLTINFSKGKSCPEHWHCHLIKLKVR